MDHASNVLEEHYKTVDYRFILLERHLVSLKSVFSGNEIYAMTKRYVFVVYDPYLLFFFFLSICTLNKAIKLSYVISALRSDVSSVRFQSKCLANQYLFKWICAAFLPVHVFKLQWFVTFSSGAAMRSGREILLQAFNWESHKHDWWRNLERKVPDISKSGFTSAWLPPPTHSFSPEGYLPQDLYSLNSSYGSEHQLKALLRQMKQYKVRAMADIVINHRVGTTQGHGGMYNRYEGIPLSWSEHAVTCCTGGLGNRSTGDNFHGVPNIDHTQYFVRKDIKTWLQWLRNNVGFQDFRFDFARGYSAKYVREYIEGSKPIFCVGEYWDSCNYNGSTLEYNQDSHRQRIINWIDATGQLSAAFDFTTKGILQEAVKGQFWRLRDAKGKPPGVMGWWPSRAVTFLENHDTGSTQGHWPFPSNHIMEGYAYILTHPGMPTVFYDHFYDWGSSIHDQIVKLIDIRRRHDLNSRSSIRILEAQPNLYAAIIGEKVSLKIGSGTWCPAGREWSLATSGERYAVWQK